MKTSHHRKHTLHVYEAAPFGVVLAGIVDVGPRPIGVNGSCCTFGICARSSTLILAHTIAVLRAFAVHEMKIKHPLSHCRQILEQHFYWWF